VSFVPSALASARPGLLVRALEQAAACARSISDEMAEGRGRRGRAAPRRSAPWTRRIGAPTPDPAKALDDRRAARVAGTASTAARPRPAAPATSSTSSMPGEQDDADPARAPHWPFSSRQNAEAVHPGHADVEHDHVGADAPNGATRPRRRSRPRRPRPGRPRRSSSGAGGTRIVIDQQQAHFVSPRIEKPCRQRYRSLGPNLERDLPRSGEPRRSRAASAGRGGGPSARSVRAEQAPEPARRELRTEDGGRRRASLAVREAAVVELRRRPPALARSARRPPAPRRRSPRG
jgi:hypothetical protein